MVAHFVVGVLIMVEIQLSPIFSIVILFPKSADLILQVILEVLFFFKPETHFTRITPSSFVGYFGGFIPFHTGNTFHITPKCFKNS